MELKFDLENPLLLSSSESFPVLFETETHHMPAASTSTPDCLPQRRRLVLSFILEFSVNFDRFASYLAINYADRFLSVHPIEEGKPWMLKLVAVSCFSLALKMMKMDFSLSHFQDDVDSRTVKRMEMIILGALNWRMRSVNPFSFVTYFLSFLNLDNPKTVQELKDMATHIIFKAQYDMKIAGLRPSIIAASAILCAARELLPSSLQHLTNSISLCQYINKENLCECYQMMQHLLTKDGCDSFFQTSSTLCTPPDLLDVECLTSSRNKRMRETNVCISKEIRITKRLKFGDFTTKK